MESKKRIAIEILDECLTLVEQSLDDGQGEGLSAYEVIAGVLNAMYMRDVLMDEIRQRDIMVEKEIPPATNNVFAFKKDENKK